MDVRHATEMRRCLEDIDVAGARRLWSLMAPHVPQDATDAQLLVTLHMARTAAESINLRHRAYSHRWLLDNGHSSQLPDALKPRAERIYPRVVASVGIAAMSKYPEVAREIGGAMIDVVENSYADGETDPAIVRPRMMEARHMARKRIGL